MEHMQTQLSLH